MPNLKKTLPSGAELEVTMSGFKEVTNLHETVMREVAGLDFDRESTINLYARLAASRAIKEALWPCIERATYNGAKITLDTFEPEAARADFYVVAQEVLVFNLRPFLTSLGSQFAALIQKIIGSPK